MKNWYGCYLPEKLGGTMCVQSVAPNGETDDGIKITKRNADRVYAEMWDGYRDGQDMKRDLEVDSSIRFCRLCNRNVERCERYRKSHKMTSQISTRLTRVKFFDSIVYSNKSTTVITHE